MRLIAILALATLILAPFTAQAQRPFYPDTYVWIDSVTVTADTALASINTAYAEQVIVSLELGSSRRLRHLLPDSHDFD
jgi:hypothetical protein